MDLAANHIERFLLGECDQQSPQAVAVVELGEPATLRVPEETIKRAQRHVFLVRRVSGKKIESGGASTCAIAPGFWNASKSFVADAHQSSWWPRGPGHVSTA